MKPLPEINYDELCDHDLMEKIFRNIHHKPTDDLGILGSLGDTITLIARIEAIKWYRENPLILGLNYMK
jgi:hypothetical protein